MLCVYVNIMELVHEELILPSFIRIFKNEDAFVNMAKPTSKHEQRKLNCEFH